MKLVGMTTCRNSGWCLNATLPATLRWCDSVIVLDHASTDDTPVVLASLQKLYPGRIHWLEEHDPLWREAQYRQRMLDVARGDKATHMAIVDDDEYLSLNWLPRIRNEIEKLDPGEVLQVPWVILWRSLNAYRSDRCQWSSAMVSLAFKDTPAMHWRTRDGYDHHHRHPFESTHKHVGTLHDGGVLHFQHANWQRLCAKQVWYRMVEQVRWPEFGNDTIERKYAGTTNEDGLITTPVPAEWWNVEDKAKIDINRRAWQENEIVRMLKEHGPDRFKGLNLMGLL